MSAQLLAMVVMGIAEILTVFRFTYRLAKIRLSLLFSSSETFELHTSLLNSLTFYISVY